jgi:hypothetical protein
MSNGHSRSRGDERPLVAVICAVPLLGEAVASTLDFADVRCFAADGGDVAGLLRWLKPDAAVFDTEDGALDATAFADEYGLPVLHISVRDQTLRLFRRGMWEYVSNGDGPTPEEIRNVIAGALFARHEVEK